MITFNTYTNNNNSNVDNKNIIQPDILPPSTTSKLLCSDKLSELYEQEAPLTNLTFSNTVNSAFEIECLQTLASCYCSKNMKIVNTLLTAETYISATLILMGLYDYFNLIPLITIIIISVILFIEGTLKTSSSLNLLRLTQKLFQLSNLGSQYKTLNHLSSIFWSTIQFDHIFFNSLAESLKKHLLHNKIPNKTAEQYQSITKPKSSIDCIKLALQHQRSSFNSLFESQSSNFKSSNNQLIRKNQQDQAHYEDLDTSDIYQINFGEEKLNILETAERKNRFIKESFSELFRFIQFRIKFLPLKILIFIHLLREFSNNHNRSSQLTVPIILLFQISIPILILLRLTAQLTIDNIYVFRNHTAFNKKYNRIFESSIRQICNDILIILLGTSCQLNSCLERSIFGVYIISSMLIYFLEDTNKMNPTQQSKIENNTTITQDKSNNSNLHDEFLKPKFNSVWLNSSNTTQCILQICIGICIQDNYYINLTLICLNIYLLLACHAKYLIQFTRNQTPNTSPKKHFLYTGDFQNIHRNDSLKAVLQSLVTDCHNHIVLTFGTNQVTIENQFGHVEVSINNQYNGSLIGIVQSLMTDFCHSHFFKILNGTLLHTQLSFILHIILFQFDTSRNVALCPLNYLLRLPISDDNKYHFLPLMNQIANNKMIHIMKVNAFYSNIAPFLFQNPASVLYDLLMID